MYEDLSTNCMVNSLKLFSTTINNKPFQNMPVILVLNNKDLFKEKIVKVPITKCPAFADFEEYIDQSTIHKNPNNYEQAVDYIKHKFKSLNKSKERKQIYSHVTCKMDKKIIEGVITDVGDIVVAKSLFGGGLR